MINILMSRSGALNATWAKDELNKHLKPKMKVVIVGFSFFNNLDEVTYFNEYGQNSEYQLKLTNNFLEYGINDINWLYYYQQTKAEMVELINSADVLYFPGGAPDLMFERIKEKAILENLKNFKGIVIGSSAGAMIQLANYHISKDQEYFKFSFNEGLGYLDDFFIEVHYRRRRPQKSSMRKVRKTYKKPVYIIPDDGMIVVSDSQILTLGSAKLYYTKNKKSI